MSVRERFQDREPWMLNATFADDTEENGVFAFCPVEIDDDGSIQSIKVGMTFISDEPPDFAVFVGVFHSDGQEACDAWCAAHDEFIQALREKRGVPA